MWHSKYSKDMKSPFIGHVFGLPGTMSSARIISLSMADDFRKQVIQC